MSSKIELNGNISAIIPDDDLDNSVVVENANVEIVTNNRPLTPDNSNAEVFEEITQQLHHLHSTPKPVKDINSSTPPPSPADFKFDKEPLNFIHEDHLTVSEHVTSNEQTPGM